MRQWLAAVIYANVPASYAAALVGWAIMSFAIPNRDPFGGSWACALVLAPGWVPAVLVVVPVRMVVAGHLPNLWIGLCWLVYGAVFAAAYARFSRARRREDRAAAGLCLRCGYDLRASGGRCPECGEPAAGNT